jgi:hypothetical protein
MSEWWTYRLYDFLLFTPRTYYRLFELYNSAIWPAQIVALAIGVLLVVMCARGAGRPAAFVLAAAWLWVAVAFLGLRYATINWAATYAAWGFGVQAAVLLWIAIRGHFDPPSAFARRVGLGIVLFAVLVEPLSGLILGRPLHQIELFGLTPDPTAVATLGALIVLRPKRRWALMIVPVLWCLFTGLTLLAMNARDWWIAPTAAVLTIVIAMLQRSHLQVPEIPT